MVADHRAAIVGGRPASINVLETGLDGKLIAVEFVSFFGGGGAGIRALGAGTETSLNTSSVASSRRASLAQTDNTKNK
jgi:hypothetical protein